MPAGPEPCDLEMQFLPPLTRDPKVAAREAPAGARCLVIHSCLEQPELEGVPEVGAAHVDDGNLEWCFGALRMSLNVVA